MIVKEVLVVAGADEMFVDDIEAFSKIIEVCDCNNFSWVGCCGRLTKVFQSAHPACETVITQRESHDQPLIDALIGRKTQCVQEQTVKAWFANKI